MVHQKPSAAFLAVAAAVLLMAASPSALAGPTADKTQAAQQKTIPVSDETVTEIQRAIDEQRYVDAGNLLDQALIASGGDPKLLLLAGRLDLSRGSYADALSSFKNSESDPKLLAGAKEGEGIALSLLGRSREAIAALQAAVTEDPSSWRAWNALGTEYDRAHDWSRAEAAYDHALSDSDRAPIVLNNRGFSLLLQNHLEEASALFVEALEKKPDFVSARNNLRLSIAMKGDYDRAVTGAATADRASALNNAGFVALLRGDYPQAENLLGQAMKAKGEYYARAAANLETTHSLETGNKPVSENAKPGTP